MSDASFIFQWSVPRRTTAVVNTGTRVTVATSTCPRTVRTCVACVKGETTNQVGTVTQDWPN